MTKKEQLEKICPRIRQESHKGNGFGKKYYLIRNDRDFMYLAEGETPAKAWTKAYHERFNGLNQINKQNLERIGFQVEQFGINKYITDNFEIEFNNNLLKLVHKTGATTLNITTITKLVDFIDCFKDNKR